ncbi:WhiB family transcriptional regulator [Rhodococcus jostii]|uniref:Transcriptional regulator WhiB n=1 Tax=Rhodococcus jostii TaxID=132919 RepID=A0A1H5MBM6_RHOJO|nr:WhiB family transcriptional regulator [Rhodococcus jostii]SEE86091.1 WhiB family transcriptional regulator, redox-sensing transcriptional regulator [Rhodococcus jostii]
MSTPVTTLQRHDTELWQWRLSARCHGEDAEIFFPADAERRNARSEREDLAKEFCRACPVLRECLAYALDTGQQHGVWGATTPGERLARRGR